MRNYILNSTPATHYTTAIAGSGGRETETYPALRADGYGSILTVRIKSKENLAWKVELLNDDSEILYSHSFAEADATEDGTTYAYSKIINWPIPSFTKPTITIGIRNMSSAAKTATTNGALTLTLVIEK